MADIRVRTIAADRDSRRVPVTGDGDGGTNAQELVRRMRQGDRHAAATFFDRYRSRIRRRIRGKLAPTMRRLFDSQEIMSTVGRRLDLYVRDGKLQAVSEEQLWALVFKMADHALIDKARLFRRLEATEGEDGQFAREMLIRLQQDRHTPTDGVEEALEKALAALTDQTDRQILTLWLSGVQQKVIAEYVGLAPTAVRKRWQRIRAELRERFEAGLL